MWCLSVVTSHDASSPVRSTASRPMPQCFAPTHGECASRTCSDAAAQREHHDQHRDRERHRAAMAMAERVFVE